MEKLDTADGQLFIKNLATFVRTHEKALANALQLSRHQPPRSVEPIPASNYGGFARSATASALVAALTFGTLSFSSHAMRSATLTLTPHHLFYLLSRFEELSVPVGPMNVRLETISSGTSAAYVSFLSRPRRACDSDSRSIHSVSSVRSVMSGMTTLWSSLGLASHDETKLERARMAAENDLKYLCSAFTKIPCLRLAPDHRARLIRGYEEFPFDTAVPLNTFKNLSVLEVIDVDFRSLYGWDRLAEQLKSLTLKNAHIEDPEDVLVGIVLDDIDRRRRRSAKHHSSQHSPASAHPTSSTPPPFSSSVSVPVSPASDNRRYSASFSPQNSLSGLRCSPDHHVAAAASAVSRSRAGSTSPPRPSTASKNHHRHRGSRIRRTGSAGSTNSSDQLGGWGSSSSHPRNRSSSSVFTSASPLPSSKWRFLRHLSLTDNSLTFLGPNSLAAVADTLYSLDLSWNLFVDVPDCLNSLLSLRSLNLSHCMIESLQSLSRCPLSTITALTLKGNRLHSLSGIEHCRSLERLDLRDNHLVDPMEIQRLTGMPNLREIWVSGNPFVKTHSNYRLIIFNLFRATPGFSVDIVIDTTGPGYYEKKQLLERVPAPETSPTATMDQNDDNSLTVTRVQSQEVFCSAPKSRPPPSADTSASRTARSRRIHKKKAVMDLNEGCQHDSNQVEPVSKPATGERLSLDSNDAFGSMRSQELPISCYNDPFRSISRRLEPIPSTGSTQSREPERPSPSSRSRHSHVTAANAQTPTAHISAKPTPVRGPDSVDWAPSSNDSYRRRLQTLKLETGSKWLTVISDGGWEAGNGQAKEIINMHSPPAEFVLGPPLETRTSGCVIATSDTL